MSEDVKTIQELIVRARAAQKQIENYSQEQIDQMCLSVGWEVYKDENIQACAKIAVEETGMGNSLAEEWKSMEIGTDGEMDGPDQQECPGL